MIVYDQSLTFKASASLFSPSSRYITPRLLLQAFLQGFAPLFCLDCVPDAYAVFADLTASDIAEIPEAIADLPAAVTFTAVSS
jgi:hypothetical protein